MSCIVLITTATSVAIFKWSWFFARYW